MCESFFATLECELLNRRRFASQAEALCGAAPGERCAARFNQRHG